MKAIYTATADAHSEEEDQRHHLFVSVDKEHWLEIDSDHEVVAADYAEIADHFEPKTDEHGVTRGHITLATRYLRCWMKNLKFQDPIIVQDGALV